MVDAGKIGTFSQCRGLGAALSLSPQIYPLTIRWFHRLFPPSVRVFPLLGVCQREIPVSPPWPDLIISGGRNSAAPAAHIRHKSQGRTKAVHILNPHMAFDRFDAVILPRHDNLSGPNVVHMTGALTPLTDESLKAAGETWAGAFAHLPKPWTTVLMGGGNKVYPFTQGDLDDLIHHLDAFVQKTGGALLMTPSRRTPPAWMDRLKGRLGKIPHFLWNGQGPNPYLGLLSLADHCIVTADSVSMVTETAFLGKPLFIHHLRGGSDKFRRFHGDMEARGYTCPLIAPYEWGGGIPLREMPHIVAQIRALIQGN